jgi:hypothetical protein
MRKSEAHEYRQAYNAQAVVCAEGSQLILATNMATTPSDQPTFAATILAMEHTIGLPHTVLADAGFASGAAVAKPEAKNVEPLIAIARTQPHRPPACAGAGSTTSARPQTETPAPHPGTLAPGDDGETRKRRRQVLLQKTQTDCRTGLRYHQERHRIYPRPPPQPREHRHRAARRRPRL